MIRLCVILPPNYFPYPLRSGGAQAVFQMIDALRSTMEIALVFAYKKKESIFVNALKKLWPNVAFIGFENTLRQQMRHPANIFSRISSILFKKTKFFRMENIYGPAPINFAYIEFIAKVLKESQFDVVQTEFFPALQYAYAMPQGMKKIFVQHEIHFMLNSRFLRQDNQAEAYTSFLAQKTKTEEIAMLNQYEAVVSLTETDKNIMKRNGVIVPVYASPAIVSIPKSSMIEVEEYHFTGKLSFLASAANSPNREGLGWFLENCWEHILERIENIKLQVIGEWPRKYSKSIQKQYRNVEFLGYVDDLQSALAGSIMIVPLLSGSGMRIKIMDAVNYGCPIVTTSVGVEGLDFRNEVDCLIEDKADLFADKLCDLTRNEAKQKQLRESAKGTMERLYSKEVLAQKRMAVYRSL
jgi:glycosyltransferase involved in cell wall biosynthesis